MAKELKQMLNRVTIQGTLMDNSIEAKVDKNGRKYLSGELEVMTDNDYVIPVSVFTYELKTNGEKNPMYGKTTSDYQKQRAKECQSKKI